MKKILLFLLAGTTILLAGCAYFPFTHIPSAFVLFPFVFILFLIIIGIYFLPTILAIVRHKKSALGIVLLNIFLGWTFIGWVAALVWALV